MNGSNSAMETACCVPSRRDLEVCIFLSIREPAHFVACMMHIVFNSAAPPDADQGAVPRTFGARSLSRFDRLPENVLLFDLAR